MVRPDIALACIISLAAGSVPAADWTEQLSRSVELPSHNWLAAVRNNPETRVTAFTTDGCSGGMSSLWSYIANQYPAFAEAHGGHPPWEKCCVEHDRAYHTAGPDPDADASYDSRLAADNTLKACVESTADNRDQVLRDQYGLTETQVRAAYVGISESMFLAVRLGGAPCTGLPWRGGYGFPPCWQTDRD